MTPAGIFIINKFKAEPELKRMFLYLYIESSRKVAFKSQIIVNNCSRSFSSQ